MSSSESSFEPLEPIGETPENSQRLNNDDDNVEKGENHFVQTPSDLGSSQEQRSNFDEDSNEDQDEDQDDLSGWCGTCLVMGSGWANKAPCCWALLVILIPIICTISILGVKINLETDGSSFAVRNDKFEFAETAAFLANDLTLFRLSDAQLVTNATAVDLQSEVNWVLTIFWEDRSDDRNILTNERLDFMLRVHRQIFQTVATSGNYTNFCLLSQTTNTSGLLFPPCSNPQTVLEFFYPQSSFTSLDDPPPRTGDPDLVVQQILNSAQRDTFLDFLGNSFDETTRTGPNTRAIFPFATPLNGFQSSDMDFNDQESLYSKFIFEVQSTALNENSDRSSEVDIRMTWLEELLLDDAFNNLIFGDTIFAIVAIIVLWLYIWFHTGSLFISLGSMIHILLSFGWAAFFFSVIYQITLFPFLNVLGIYIILGIGADDVFIFLDAWKQSQKIENIKNSLETRMAWTYARASKSMLITSLTTAVAFFINATSSVVAVSLFGIFTGTMVMLNYVLVVTWFPLIVLFWTNHLEKRNFKNYCGFKKEDEDIELDDMKKEEIDEEKQYSFCFCIPLEKPFLSSPDEDSFLGKLLKQKDEDEDNLKKDVYAANINDFRILERFFYNWFVPILAKTKYCILFFFIILIALTITGAVMLAPSDKPARFLPSDHPIQIAFDLLNDEFSGSNAFSQVQLFWGIDKLDTSGRDRYNFNDRGTLIWNVNFDPTSAEAQQLYLNSCNELRTRTNLAIRNEEIFCVLEDFNQFHNVTPPNFIVGPAFIDALQNFTENFAVPKILSSTGDILSYENSIGWDQTDAENGVRTLRYISIVGNLTIERGQTFDVVLNIYDDWVSFINELERNAQNIPGMSLPLQSSEDWRTAETQRQLIRTAVLGIGVSLGLAYVVILISTKNFIIAFYTTFSIGAIVCFVLTFIVFVGWGLGIIESISITILVGLSVDYVTHIANSINESRLKGRFPRVRQGMTEIGISIFSSAITTTLSAVLLLAAIVIFFVRFGIFIIITILASFIYSFFFFPALSLTPLGLPNHQIGNYSHHGKQIYKKLQEMRSKGE